MARIIELASQTSVQMKVGDQVIKLCACGLSKTFPHCDGTHKITRDEDPLKVYRYEKDGSRKEVIIAEKEKEDT